MANVFSFLWGHPSLTAILAFALLYIVLYVRADNSRIDQTKDNLYGSAKGFTGRLLDREKRGRNDQIIWCVALCALCVFLGYRFFKFIGLV